LSDVDERLAIAHLAAIIEKTKRLRDLSPG
jgi:hypothetical protein